MDNEERSSALSAGAIVAITLGSVALAAALAVGTFFGVKECIANSVEQPEATAKADAV